MTPRPLLSVSLAFCVALGAGNAAAQESELAALRGAAPSDAAAQLRLGRALRRAGHFDEAVRALRLAARGATRAEGLFEIARVRFDQGDFRASRTACETLPAGRGARDAAGLLRRVCMARAHLVWQRAALAEREITAAQAIDPNNGELKLVVADSLRVGGRIAEAETAYRAAAAALSGRSEPWVGLGLLFETAQRLDDARTAFQRAVEVDPRDPLAAMQLGRLLRKQRAYDQALPLLQRATTDRPDWPEALVNLGEVHLARNTLDAALAALQRAVELAPAQGGAQSALGRTHLKAGRVAEAEPPLRRAIEQVANDAEARCALAELLGRTSRGEESIEEWNRAIDLMPGDASPRMRAAEQARAMHLNTLARAYLDRILAEDQQNAPALLLRADIAFDENDRNSARQMYTAALAGRGTIDRARASARIQEIDAPRQRPRRR